MCVSLRRCRIFPSRYTQLASERCAMFEKTTAVILAAGQGTRMKSSLPKVLHPIAGRPLIHYPVRAALEAGCGEVVVVVGHGREHLEGYLRDAFGASAASAG